jgi:hypothetical protein
MRAFLMMAGGPKGESLRSTNRVAPGHPWPSRSRASMRSATLVRPCTAHDTCTSMCGAGKPIWTDAKAAWIARVVSETVARSLPRVPALRDTSTSLYVAASGPRLQAPRRKCPWGRRIYGGSQKQPSQSIQLATICVRPQTQYHARFNSRT